MKPARQNIGGYAKAGPLKRIGQHGVGNRLAVDKHAITIEDDHRSLR